MPRSRIAVHISFPTQDDHDQAKQKSDERGRNLSKQIQWYFDNLPHLDGTKPDIDGPMAIFKDAMGDTE